MIPPATGLREAAEALRTASRPALVLGGGARGAAGELLALAEELSAPVVTTANGKGIVDESHPLSLGVSLHSPAVQKWLTERDVVLAVGTELAESDLWSGPPPLGGTLVRVDMDPAQMYAALPADVALVGDAQQVLGALLAACRDAGASRGQGGNVTALRPGRDAGRVPWICAAYGTRGAEPTTRGTAARYLRGGRRSASRAGRRDPGAGRALAAVPPGDPQRPRRRRRHHLRQRPVLLLRGPAASAHRPRRALSAPHRIRHPRLRPARRHRRQDRDPDRQVIALSGDGGLQFSVQELATAAQLQLPLPVVVFDNGGYGEIRDEMAARGDEPAAGGPPRPSICPPSPAPTAGTVCTPPRPGALATALTRALATPAPP